jgi:hypothetical protein
VRLGWRIGLPGCHKSPWEFFSAIPCG